MRHGARAARCVYTILVSGVSVENLQIANPAKVGLFGFRFDKVTLEQAVERVLALANTKGGGHYVVTPNLDHAAILHKCPELAEIYEAAALVLADGLPLIWASRWLGKSLSERVAGSDLVPAILASAPSPLRVYLLGARPGVAQTAAENIEKQYPNIRIVGVQSPPVGFENDPPTNDKVVKLVANTAPDLLVLGLGAPKQEIWAFRERHRLAANVTVCAGATIDFLAGERVRAPLWCQRTGLEWAYRVMTEPRRLFPRYAKDAMAFPLLLAKQLVSDAKGFLDHQR